MRFRLYIMEIKKRISNFINSLTGSNKDKVKDMIEFRRNKINLLKGEIVDTINRIDENDSNHQEMLRSTEESIENSFTLGLAARIQKNCFEALDAPIEIIGSIDTPAIPLNSILEETLLPNGDKVAEALKNLLDY